MLDSYRTTLTELTRHQVRALFILSIPVPLAELGVGQDLRAALLKLSAALPMAHRQDEERVRQRVHLDAVEWFHTREPVPHLKTIQQAVWQDRRLVLTYHLPFETRVERTIRAEALRIEAEGFKTQTLQVLPSRDRQVTVTLEREKDLAFTPVVIPADTPDTAMAPKRKRPHRAAAKRRSRSRRQPARRASPRSRPRLEWKGLPE